MGTTLACRTVIVVVLTAFLESSSAFGQFPGGLSATLPTPAAIDLPAGFNGPAPPILPATISRDAAERATLRAVRLTQPLRIDGALDEALYREVQPASDFVQIAPQDGQPASEQTQVWIAFDEDNLYVAVRCFDSNMAKLVATELRRDHPTIFMGNDSIGLMFDTFYDRRNAIWLAVNPSDGRQDGQITDERFYRADWNPVWDVKTRRHQDSWTAEAVIPFKSIRYQAGRAQIWGFQAVRVKPSKNEVSFLVRTPSTRMMSAYQHVSLYGTLVGIEAPPRSVNIDVKPYVTSNLMTDRSARPPISNDPGGDIGLDAKVSVTQNLTADVTYNTDFAQVEADEQQVNLTRFGLFLPEKRDFFVENQGTFGFGGVPITGMMGGTGDAPILFYSRRIGLNGSRAVPIDVGGRLTGRVGKFMIGALNIQSGDEPVSGARATNFSVFRLRRDFLRRSSVGVIFTGRATAANGVGSNRAYGLDGTFAFFENLNINTYWARTETSGTPDGTSYRSQLDYAGDRYGVQLERLDIGDNFNPEAGFLRRDDLKRNFAQLRFSPRPRGSRRIRKFVYQASLEYLETGSGVLDSRERGGEFAIEFQNVDRFSVTYTGVRELLPAPFRIATGVTLPTGIYDYDNIRVGYNASSQHQLSANIGVEYGTFYNGHKTTVSLARGRMNASPRLSMEPTYSLNRVSLVQGDFTTHLIGSRVTFTMTPRMFTSALVQYNSSSRLASANVRLRWEYQPGSELFVVFNEERDAWVTGFPDLTNRAFIVKVNRLFRF